MCGRQGWFWDTLIGSPSPTEQRQVFKDWLARASMARPFPIWLAPLFLAGHTLQPGRLDLPCWTLCSHPNGAQPLPVPPFCLIPPEPEISTDSYLNAISSSCFLHLLICNFLPFPLLSYLLHLFFPDLYENDLCSRLIFCTKYKLTEDTAHSGSVTRSLRALCRERDSTVWWRV